MAKAIMIQGTMSNVGKSFIAAALCRIFKQDGYKVAPFKSQNMALNSFITEEGLEMGRAQVMQAEAAGIKPTVAMNPILLKPTNDIGSQVIVMGEPRGNMKAKDYYKNKLSLVPEIMTAYNTLDKEYDIIVIEGAGSPAEINLKENDIVNMGMAKLAKAPVLLVGDIDRGGVFAQLIGTLTLLEKDEQNYVKALVVNRFRGDRDILQSGIDILEEKSKRAVIGVVPYISCDIDDEDSLSERFNKKTAVGLVDIAVVRLPRISNFTDFNAFERVECVSLRYVDNIKDIGNPDIIIIPGSKNTIGDMLWLRQKGFESVIKKLVYAGTALIGICGGYQMLGNTISDPNGIEAEGSIRAMEFLPVSTVFNNQKERTRVKGKIKKATGLFSCLEGQSFEGYEIHMGTTAVEGEHFAEVLDIVTGNVKNDGYAKGNIFGTYVHGIFDNEAVVNSIVNAVLNKKGIDKSVVSAFDAEAYKQQQYDILAKTVRESVDMDMIYKILEEGVK